MEQNGKYERQFNFMQLFFELFRKKSKIILVGIAMAVLIIVFKFITADATLMQETQITYNPTTYYTGTAKIFLGSKTDTATAEAVRTFLTGHNVLQSVIDDINLDMEYPTLFDMINLQYSTDTIVNITIIGKKETMVQNITNSFVLLGSQKIADNFKNSEVMILEPASTNEAQYNAETSTIVKNYSKLLKELLKYGIVGFVFGAFIVTAVYFLLFMMDSSIKDEKDIEGYLGVPLIGTIPVIKGTRKNVILGKNKRNLRLSQYTIE